MHFEAVIVGSGFGGSVMAYRLAQAGYKVCVLERGKSYPPGSFPRSPFTMQNNFWDPSKGLQGLFNVWSFRNSEALVASGLGGGSLIYANVLIRKDANWFGKNWLISRTELDFHYDNVEAKLCPQKYPFDFSPYDQTPKTIAFKQAAEELIKQNPQQFNWLFPDLAVLFSGPGQKPFPAEPIPMDPHNIHKVQRYTCRLCGECDIGCNYGSKNTLDHTYLSDAKTMGAEIRTLCEVRSFKPMDKSGYIVKYVEHKKENEGKEFDTSKLPLEEITCDKLILAAGTLGTTYLLLKNKREFNGKLSKTLGTHYCGNGDFLTFALKSKSTIDGKMMPRIINASYGPVITGAIRSADKTEGGNGPGFYIQDAGYPEFLNWVTQTIDLRSSFRRYIRFLSRYICGLVGINIDSDLSAEIAEVLTASHHSYSSLPLLGMGLDTPDGNMKLRDDRFLDIDWDKRGSKDLFKKLKQTSKEIAGAMQATFQENPIGFLSRTITVHPLGGCPMGRNESEGVVNSFGEVFNCPGLYIADGSVLPGPVGANPSMTIAALADRFADEIIRKEMG